jgi:hypothetical protein
MEHAYGWEVEGLSRRLDVLEERLARRDRERLENAMMLFWVVWVAAMLVWSSSQL